MPWNCTACAVTLNDDQRTCPTCRRQKTSWTIVGNQTRNVVITRKKLELKVGGADATQVPVFTTAAARSMGAASDAQVLTARVVPGKKGDTGITIAVQYDAREVQELRFPGPPAEEGEFQARFLFVHGTDPAASSLAVPDVSVVDLSEATPRGFAPAVEVSGLGKAPKRLAVQKG